MPNQPARQIHLDFHTSPFITGVGDRFDPEGFAETMAEARVQSVNVFAKCHHGMSYYPTKIGQRHPHLKQADLLGEMIESLHRRGIRAPIYTPVVWEENVADEHPEWRQMRSDGTFSQLASSSDALTVQPGRWRFNSFVHPEYQDYFEAHLLELLENYEVDGLWIDILFMDQGACFNEASIRERVSLGLEKDTLENNARFESLMQQKFCARFTRLIRDHRPDASIFYNSTNRAFVDPRFSWARRADHQTHSEIESLPSGFWGYHHFPRFARQAQLWDMPFVGMTGRFQKMWGDFGGIKPLAALEYECFRIQALGGSCSVGDQMLPDGTLDSGAYRLIGDVYRKIEGAEGFYLGTRPCPQGAVVLSAAPGMDEDRANQTDEGAVLMFGELRHDVAVIDSASDLSGFEFVVLPDSTPIDAAFRESLRAYHATGGRLIISHRAGFDRNGRWALDFLPLTIAGPQPLFPSYWKASDSVSGVHASDFRVIYQQGMSATGGKATSVLVERFPPYFKRSDLRFCSHFQTPPDPNAQPEPAVIAGDGFVYFADPVFSEYRQAGNAHVREIVGSVMSRSGAKPRITGGLDLHVEATFRRREADLGITLINYIPTRKSLAVDVVDSSLSFAGQSLVLDREIKCLRLYEGASLQADETGAFPLPSEARGRLLLTAEGYFGA